MAVTAPLDGAIAPGWRSRWRPSQHPEWAVLALPVAMNLWLCRHMLQRVSWPNDVPFHVAMVDWAMRRMRTGAVPLDGWFPRLSGGFPQFHMYQSLPHQLTAAVARVVGVETAVNFATYALWCTWPVAVYLGAWAFGMDRLASCAAACIAPFIVSAKGYGFELASYSWIGFGLWSQLWGMWMFPLALGWSARAVAEGRRFVRAGVAMALTVAFHLPTAWFALVCLGLWLVVRPTRLLARLPRVALLGAGSVMVASWVLVPLISDQSDALSSTFYKHNTYTDSFGGREVSRMFVRGQLTDSGRFPIVSVCALVGLGVALSHWRRPNPRWQRELPAVAALSLFLYVGRQPFGFLIDLIPGSSSVFLHRYHVGFQFASTLLAGAGIAATGRALVRAWHRLDPRTGADLWLRLAGTACVLGVVAAIVVPHYMHNVDGDRGGVEAQHRADSAEGPAFDSLVALAVRRGGGRIYAGRINNWGNDYRIGSSPAPIRLAYYPIDEIGYNLRVGALQGDLETYLNDLEVEQLRLLGIRYVLAPRGHAVAPTLHVLATAGNNVLYEVPNSTWFAAVNTLGPAWKLHRDDLGGNVLDALGKTDWQGDDRRLITVDGRPTGAAPTANRPGSGAPGQILRSRVETDAGRFRAVVSMQRRGAVVAKAGWNPRWEVTVDGVVRPTIMTNPFQVAVDVPAGRHDVVFRYVPYSLYWLWFAVGCVGLAMLWWLPRRFDLRERGPEV